MPHALNTRVVIGLAIAAALGLADLVGLLAPAPDLGDPPPWVLTLVVGVAGAVTLAAAVVAFFAPSSEKWHRAGPSAAWLVVGSRAVSVLANIPVAFNNGSTTPLIVWTTVVVVATAVAVVLIVVGTVREPAGT